jgi:hypothetical protein
MHLTAYSRNRVLETFQTWKVDKDFADPMYNYLVFGFNPGSCFTSVLANDFLGAVARSHPANTISAFKALGGWMRDTLPPGAYGSYEAVESWCQKSDEERRHVLEYRGLVLTPEQETWAVLNNEPTREPSQFF